MENATKMKVEIWSDIMCPFCYIGKRNFETALSQFASKALVEVEWKSFQLDPAMPDTPDYQHDMYQFVADRKGLSYEQSRAMHQHVAQSAKSVGLTYNLDKALVTNSLRGHRILQFAKTKGLGEQAEERLFCAYFTEGKNLSESATLIQLGQEIGLSEAEVKEALANPYYSKKIADDAQEAQLLGARGVPFFVLNRKYAIAGAQQPAEILKALGKSFAEWQKDTSHALQTIAGQVCALNSDCK